LIGLLLCVGLFVKLRGSQLLICHPLQSALAVFSGCASYNPSTFEGGIAAGCWLSVAVGPDGTLHTTNLWLPGRPSDVAVTADGYELFAFGQDVLYKDPTLDR